MYKDFFILFLCFGILLYFLFFVKKRECYDDPIIVKLHAKILPLDERIKYVKIVASNASFTEDKQTIFLCIKDKDGNYYDNNTLLYVLIHEICHYLTKSVIETKEGHNNPEFLAKFKELLTKAAELGIYDPSIPVAHNYCGYNT